MDMIDYFPYAFKLLGQKNLIIVIDDFNEIFDKNLPFA